MGYDSSSGDDRGFLDVKNWKVNKYCGRLPESDKNEDKKLTCSVAGCSKVFSRADKLQRHSYIHTGERPHVCSFENCTKKYTSVTHLRRHVKTAHEKSSYKSRFKCLHPGCTQELSSQVSLRRHFDRRHNPEHVLEHRFQCTSCPLKFMKKQLLAQHMFDHTGVAAYSCEQCSVTFSCIRLFKRHNRTHTTYTCECMQTFERWSVLQAHRRLCHQKVFECSTCSKSFNSKTNLKFHNEVHKEVRTILQCPYEQCPRFYYYKRNLTHHISSAHEGKKFKCPRDGCDRELKNKRTLDKHIKLHDKRTPKTRKKYPRKRKDAGKPKTSMVVKLTGLDVKQSTSKQILNGEPVSDLPIDFISVSESETETIKVDRTETSLLLGNSFECELQQKVREARDYQCSTKSNALSDISKVLSQEVRVICGKIDDKGFKHTKYLSGAMPNFNSVNSVIDVGKSTVIESRLSDRMPKTLQALCVQVIKDKQLLNSCYMMPNSILSLLMKSK